MIDMDFVQRANEIELRLEADGMLMTAKAMREVVAAYLKEEAENFCQMSEPKTSKPYYRLT